MSMSMLSPFVKPPKAENATPAQPAKVQAKPKTEVESEKHEKVLSKYTEDITAKAKAGKIDPVIGRDAEIRRVIQILARRTKNNPVLTGEPGVGKSAIVEGLARRIASGDVPVSLQNRRLLTLDLAALVAGTRYRGDFEGRLKAVLNEVIALKGQVIMFVDEIHTIIGAGGGEGSMDAANLLKPALARGDFPCIGATTKSEYKILERDPAMARRFQPVDVKEPTAQEAISILRGLKGKYELHHGVKIKDDALVSAVVLSSRWIKGRYLPDKAIDLIDEAGSALRIEIDTMPTQIDEIHRRINQLELEREGLKREHGHSHRLAQVDGEISSLRSQFTALKDRWEGERKVLTEIKDLKEKLAQAQTDMEDAIKAEDFTTAGEKKNAVIPYLEKAINQKRDELKAKQGETKMCREEVGAEDIAEIVSKWTSVRMDTLMDTLKGSEQ